MALRYQVYVAEAVAAHRHPMQSTLLYDWTVIDELWPTYHGAVVHNIEGSMSHTL